MNKEDVLYFIKKAKEKGSKSIDLSNRDIVEIPAEIGELTELEHLNLSYNEIEYLPSDIGKLVNLKTLLLLKNKIKVIPPEIGLLKNLALLDVSHNLFETFPKEIGFLSNLRSLDASYGNVRYLPVDFIDLLSLKELFLEENDFIFPPKKVIKRGLYATMHFLTSEKKRTDSAKVMLQVFNMPSLLQKPFEQYLMYFNDMVLNFNNNEVNFDIKFIRHNEDAEVGEMNVDVENYLYDFLDFIKGKIETTKFDGGKKLSLVDLQVVELRKQVSELNKSLDNKIGEIQSIQKKMDAFLDTLNNNKE